MKESNTHPFQRNESDSDEALIERFNRASNTIIKSGIGKFNKEQLKGIFKLENITIVHRNKGATTLFKLNNFVEVKIETNRLQHGRIIADAYKEISEYDEEPPEGFVLFSLCFWGLLFCMFIFLDSTLHKIRLSDQLNNQPCTITEPKMEYIGEDKILAVLLKGKLTCETGLSREQVKDFIDKHKDDEIKSESGFEYLVYPKSENQFIHNSGIENLPTNTALFTDMKSIEKQNIKEDMRREAIKQNTHKTSFEKIVDDYFPHMKSIGSIEPKKITINATPPEKGYVSILTKLKTGVVVKNN